MSCAAQNNVLFFDTPSPRPTKAQLRQARRMLKTAKKVSKHGTGKLTPKNEAQREYMDALEENDLLFALGPAGTGKTYVVARWAAEKLLADEIDKIVITRPMVAVSNENVGFLPGGLEEKIAPWAKPLYDAFKESVGSKVKLDELIKAEKIEFAPFAYIRGRTFSDSVVIADESQNLTIEQWRVLVTRIGENSRLIVTGDLAQSDLRGKNGLEYAVDMAERYDIDCEIFEFDSSDVVRSGMVKQWVKAFEHDDER